MRSETGWTRSLDPPAAVRDVKRGSYPGEQDRRIDVGAQDDQRGGSS